MTFNVIHNIITNMKKHSIKRFAGWTLIFLPLILLFIKIAIEAYKTLSRSDIIIFVRSFGCAAGMFVVIYIYCYIIKCCFDDDSHYD